jgi:uncharacterized protein YqeY
MIAQNINQQIADALKAHDALRLSTLRMLSSSFNYERINKQHDLTEEEELEVVRKEAKKRRDSIDAYKAAGRQDLVDKETAELAILEEYLPAQMTDDEVEKLVDEAIAETGATGMSDMGKVIGLVMKKANGNADGGKVAGLVKQKLA